MNTPNLDFSMPSEAPSEQPQRAKTYPAEPNKLTFAKIGLHECLLSALAKMSISTPTEVQAHALPAALKGQDIMACAPTGTGKTAAFVLPALHMLLTTTPPARGHGPRILVLTPTRELAQQVTDAVRKLASDMRCRSTVVVGGVAYGSQIQALSGHLDILIATPGRLIDHMASGKVDFSRVSMVVLDEADKMLDMGFAKPVDRILAAIEKAKPNGQKNPQMFLFTATSTKAVAAMAARALHNPHTVTLSSPTVSNAQIEQTIYRADNKEHKMALLQALLTQPDMGQAIIFSATKHGADRLADQLNAQGHASAALHGGMKQGARKRTLDQLHSKKVKFLVATDVAARGIDVKNLGHVINFDLPQVAEDYIHRIGRTGRAGATGKAISLVSTSDFPMMRDIEKMLKQRLNLQMMPGLEPRQTVGDFEKQGALAPRLGAKSGNASRGGSSGGRSFMQGPSRPQRDRSEQRGGQSGEYRGGYSSRSR